MTLAIAGESGNTWPAEIQRVVTLATNASPQPWTLWSTLIFMATKKTQPKTRTTKQTPKKAAPEPDEQSQPEASEPRVLGGPVLPRPLR
jgi:hypothetical protein